MGDVFGKLPIDKVRGDAPIRKGEVFIALPDGTYRRAAPWEIPAHVQDVQRSIMNHSDEQLDAMRQRSIEDNEL